MYGNDRTIGFSNCERYFAKGTRGISSVRKIPALTSTSPNDFLTRLFAEYNAKAAEETARGEAEKAAYEAAMARGREIIDSLSDAKTANTAMPYFKAIEHAMTSQKELGVQWKAKMKDLGLIYDPISGKYVPEPHVPEEASATGSAPNAPVEGAM